MKSFEAVANMRYSIRCFKQMALLIPYLLVQRINQCQYFTLVLVNSVTSYHISININNISSALAHKSHAACFESSPTSSKRVSKILNCIFMAANYFRSLHNCINRVREVA